MPAPFPFPFPPMDQNFAEILNAFNQHQNQQFPQPPVTSATTSASADPRRTASATPNLKKRKHTEFEQFPTGLAQHPNSSQSSSSSNRNISKSPVTGGPSFSKSSHSASAGGSFNRNKSHPIQSNVRPQQSGQQRPVTPVLQKNRSITPTSQMMSGPRGSSSSGTGRDDEMPLNLSKKPNSDMAGVRKQIK